MPRSCKTVKYLLSYEFFRVFRDREHIFQQNVTCRKTSEKDCAPPMCPLCARGVPGDRPRCALRTCATCPGSTLNAPLLRSMSARSSCIKSLRMIFKMLYKISCAKILQISQSISDGKILYSDILNISKHNDEHITCDDIINIDTANML